MGIIDLTQTVFETLSRMSIVETPYISHRQCFQYFFNETESKHIEEELYSLLNRKVIKKSETEPGEFVLSPIA